VIRAAGKGRSKCSPDERRDIKITRDGDIAHGDAERYTEMSRFARLWGISRELSVSLIEAALRGGAVVLLALVAIVLLRDARRVPAGIFSALFALGAACYTIVSASVLASDPSYWLWPARIVAMGNPVIFCLFAAALFDDDFKPSWLHAVAWLSLVAFGIFALWSGVPQARWICSGLGLVCNAIGV
jgi:hypothetical protein